MCEMLIKNASRNSHMPSRKKKTESAGMHPSSGVFNSIDEIVASLDRAKPAAKQVTKIGTKASHELQELEISVKRTMKRAPLRVANMIFGFATKSSLNVVTLADDIFNSATVTERYVKSCVMLLSFPDRLKFLKEKQEVQGLLDALVGARDMVRQMSFDSDELHNAVEVYKGLDKLIDKTGRVEEAVKGAMDDARKELISYLGGELQTSRKGATRIQLPAEKTKTSAREMREILSSVLRDWPELLTATEQLKPHLHQLTEQLDSVLQS